MSPNDSIFQRLGEAAEETFFVYNMETARLNYISPAVKNLGVAIPDNIMEQPASLITAIHPDDQTYVRSQLKSFKKHGQLDIDFRLIDAEGNEKYVQLIAYQLNGDQVAAGWLKDIDVVKKNIFYAESINAKKNSLLEILSHDLKEPVGVISMLAGAIKKDPAVAGNKALEGYLKTIEDLCEGNIKLIRSLVQEEFRQAKDITLRLERANLVDAVQDVMDQYKASASILKKSFVFEHESARLFILMDSLKLMQVINNLISNAIKFTGDEGQITVKLSDRESVARITVSDDGIGVPENLQPYLFQPRTRAQRPGVRGEAGSGMGLSIIQTLVNLHGGRVWLDTEVEKGTTVHIELPKNSTAY